MKATENALSKATSLCGSLIRRQIKPLLFILLLGCVISLQLEDALRALGPTDDGSRWVMQLAMGLWDLSEGVLVFLILSWGLPHVHQFTAAGLERRPFQEAYVSSFLAEYLKMLARILLFGLLFLIPGVVMYCWLIFVPYIALFSKKYRADSVNALTYSRELTAKFFGRIFNVFLVTTVIQLALEFLPHMYTSLYVWPARFAFMATSLLIGIWTYSYIFLLFEKAVLDEESSNGSDV